MANSDSDLAEGLNEEQDYLTAVRDGDTILLRLGDGTDGPSQSFSVEEYKEFLTQIKRTTWLTRDPEQLAEEETAFPGVPMAKSKGECHECDYEGYIVENKIGTVYCPKCRSTNVGWPHR